MQPAKAQRLMSALNAAERKVLNAVPAHDAFDITAIIAELRRNGQNADHKVVTSCLAALRSHRLIKETLPGRFTRVEVKANEEPLPEDEPVATTTITRKKPITTALVADTGQPMQSQPAIPVVPTQQDSLDRIAALAEKLRNLGLLMNQCANDLDDIGLEVEERIKKVGVDSQRLQQLRELLLNDK